MVRPADLILLDEARYDRKVDVEPEVLTYIYLMNANTNSSRINHKNCDHASTPAARKVCRNSKNEKAERKALSVRPVKETPKTEDPRSLRNQLRLAPPVKSDRITVNDLAELTAEPGVEVTVFVKHCCCPRFELENGNTEVSHYEDHMPRFVVLVVHSVDLDRNSIRGMEGHEEYTVDSDTVLDMARA